MFTLKTILIQLLCLALMVGCTRNDHMVGASHDSAVRSVYANDGFVKRGQEGYRVRLQGSSIPIRNSALRNLIGLEHLIELDASNTEIDANGLIFLMQHPELVTLHLDNCKNVNDDAIDILRRLPGLKEVSLAGTSVSSEAVSNLKSKKPNLIVDW